MKTFSRVCAVTTLLLLLPFMVRAYSQTEDPEVEKNKALQAEMERSLVAPCCWNMTVDQHESPASRKVRAEIAESIEQGKTKEEMLDYFSADSKYSERILASPSQKTLLGKMAYWLIGIALIFGIFVVGKTINTLSRSRPAHNLGGSQPQGQQGQKESSSWDNRVESELKDFDS